MVLIGTLVALLWGAPDTSVAHPTPEADRIHGTRWESVKGTTLARVDGGSSWAPIRGYRP